MENRVLNYSHIKGSSSSDRKCELFKQENRAGKNEGKKCQETARVLCSSKTL